ncbi:hypothetical protein ABW20_dc0109848 [Dactylellina cionopaga]|nr:hypothetical protein ABW20_dc0109848 [Dactylellina cionopaga]
MFTGGKQHPLLPIAQITPAPSKTIATVTSLEDETAITSLPDTTVICNVHGN